jgi:ubiquinone/menaquinone biosynthesis C-methylase UbiE
MGSQTYFDQVASNWDLMRSSFFSDAVRDRALATAEIEPGQLAVDIGAGSGFVTEALLNAGLRVAAVDQSQAMLDVMQRKFDGQPVTYHLGSSEALPLEDASIDDVFANMYLHHVERPLESIVEMARLLRPGGKLVITDLDEHDFTFLAEEHHDRWMGFRREDIQRWFETAGLADVSVSDVGSNCCAGSACGAERADISIFIAVGTRPTAK